MASRKLSDLHPKLQAIVPLFLKKCLEQDIDLLVTCTFRSEVEQNDLYNQGRTTPGHIVTNAKAGQSKHNFMIEGRPASKAIDVVPMLNGKCIWDNSDPRWKKAGAIGKSLGLDWAGDWESFKEYPHFQID